MPPLSTFTNWWRTNSGTEKLCYLMKPIKTMFNTHISDQGLTNCRYQDLRSCTNDSQKQTQWLNLFGQPELASRLPENYPPQQNNTRLRQESASSGLPYKSCAGLLGGPDMLLTYWSQIGRLKFKDPFLLPTFLRSVDLADDWRILAVLLSTSV